MPFFHKPLVSRHFEVMEINFKKINLWDFLRTEYCEHILKHFLILPSGITIHVIYFRNCFEVNQSYTPKTHPSPVFYALPRTYNVHQMLTCTLIGWMEDYSSPVFVYRYSHQTIPGTRSPVFLLRLMSCCITQTWITFRLILILFSDCDHVAKELILFILNSTSVD
jgi:hypothetical protein